MNALMVFVGGGLGAFCRWIVSKNLVASGSFPIGTFSVNMIGCLLIGLFSYYAIRGNNTIYMFIMIGFLGGFTTFSSYGLELFKLFEGGNLRTLLTYFIVSNLLGGLLVFVGYKVASVYIK